MRQVLLISTCIICLSSIRLFGQVDLIPDRFDFESDLSYDPQIQSPASFLGYELGTSFTVYARSVAYFEYLAEVSDRVHLNEYGETYEGRKLYNLVITSPENHNRLESLREQNLQLGDPRNLSEDKAEEIIDSKPVFVSYSYNIHGNEASSTEAAMQVSYRYAAATDAATSATLDRAVLIFYICINPDGRDRFAYWFESVKRSLPAIEPHDMEHQEPWPGGRTNHYWFDLNRDWIWGIHPESRGHTAEYLKWMPQIHTDYHEQGYNSNYFTMPGTTPRNKLLPDLYEAYSDTIGRANIAALNKNKVNYFTREAFDFFYPGYGSSYPSVMNAIGMLTEQGGGASRAIETDDGYVLTLRQRIWDHYSTSVATIDKSVERRKMFNRYFYESSDPDRSKLSTTAYFIEAGDDPYVSDVVNILLHHGIEVEQLDEDLSLQRAYSYRSGENSATLVPRGSYVVRSRQPKHLFVHSVLSPQMEIEDSVMYDMSTWSAPMAYNLEAYSTELDFSVSTSQVSQPLRSNGSLVRADAAYAYLIDWNQRNAPKALAMLWEKGYRVRSAAEAFSDGVTRYNPGTLIVLQGRNLSKADVWSEDMAAIAVEAGVDIRGVSTGRMEEGNDLASRKSRPLKQPKVALMVDRPFSSYTCGQIYFLFDRETRLPVQRIPAGSLNQTALPKFGGRYGTADLRDYDVLIVSGGRQLNKVFDKKALAEVKEWVEDGGTLVATESAISLFTHSEKDAFTSVKETKTPKDTSRAGKLLSFDDRSDYFGKQRIPGAALHAVMDQSHPLAFGIKKEMYALKFGNTALEPDVQFESVGRYVEDASTLLASGYASRANLDVLSGKTFAGVRNVGGGKVIFLIDNTQYRMFWRGPSRMMQNAVMLLPSF